CSKRSLRTLISGACGVIDGTMRLHLSSFPCGGQRYHFLTALRADTRGVSYRVNAWFTCSVRPLDRGLQEQKQDSKRRAKIASVAVQKSASFLQINKF